MHLSGDLSPRIGIGHGTLDERPDDVREEEDLAESQDERPERGEPVQGPEELQVVELAVIVDAAGAPPAGGGGDRGEHSVETGQSEAEVTPGRTCAVHPLRNRRGAEVE